ncbi:CidA/LrgA family protein [Celeribacter litoreus]|uniref:CidA/LrgA family protein n=1 Tax=Celeribacter litoreus TaxID=2876714 RepID=UPI001CCC9E7D|nr:CidA/LrgA family protein [Celeribacter litoreus]MCA0042321.1 CidA/LrgA family protein [Celeribacter litoreus]
MIIHLAMFLGFQLLGEVIARVFMLQLPGPVIGMVLLAALLLARPSLGEKIKDTASHVLSYLSLLYVPAGVGIVQYIDQVSEIGFPLAVALVGSTILAIGAGSLTYKHVNRLLGEADETPL